MSVLLVVGDVEDRASWHVALSSALPGEDIVLPGAGLGRAEVTVAIVAAPPHGSLSGLPKLRLIQSLWAGVDGLLADPTLPDQVPVARLVDPELTASMVESVLLHVLSLHRQIPEYRALQAERTWRPLPQPRASERQVGVLGLGELGRAAGQALAGLGFPVTGWSRSARRLDGVHCLEGEAGLARLLADSKILVNLLPLTPATAGILSERRFSQLPRGAGLINLGRGGHLVEADLLAALDTGQLGHAVLDVLGVEPAPPTHPFWTHPRITVTPHVAAPTDRHSAALIAARAIRDLHAGRRVANLVNRARSY